VLTFYDEANDTLDQKEDRDAFASCKKKLETLARSQFTLEFLPDEPLRMFVTGPAGAGKCKCHGILVLAIVLLFCIFLIPLHPLVLLAKLLEAVESYAKSFSKNINHTYTSSTIRKTAFTGAAATEIGGQTCSTEYGLRKQKVSTNDIQEHSDTRLNIVDEVSFGSIKNLLEPLNDKLGKYTNRQDLRYGNCAIVFLGDFCQLPAFGEVIYERENHILWEQALNCMVELQGTHRFNQCPDMRRIIPGFREYGLTEEDRGILNSRVIDGDKVKMPDLSATRFASWTNVKKSEFNGAVFKDYLSKHHANCTKENIPMTAIVIKANAKWAKSGTPLSFNQRKVLFEECPEGKCKSSTNKYYDPLLCLFFDCHMMANDNIDVSNGIANGSIGRFKKIQLIYGAKLIPIQLHGFWVYSVDIEQVDWIELEWYDSKFEGRFRLKPANPTCTVEYPVVELGMKKYIKVGIKMTAFPANLNHATTGHKLQGKSMDELVIVEWSKRDSAKWAYVAISRVRTLDGLYLLEPIPEDIDFTPDPEYLAMMDRLRSNVLATPEQVQELMQQFPHSPYYALVLQAESMET